MRFNLIAFNKREEDEFRTWYKEYSGKFYAHAFRFLQDKEEAKSVVGEKMLAVFRSSTEFRSLSHVQAYTYKAIRNECMDLLKQRSRQDLSLDRMALLEELMEETDLEAEDERERLYMEINRRVNELPERTRRVIRLLYYEGMTRAQVAEIMAISVSTVSNLRDLGVKALRSRGDPREGWEEVG